jgi:phosphoglycerate dehydrogenase-like enzyme
MNILFDIGTELPQSEQKRILEAWPGAQVRFHLNNADKPIDGKEKVNILVAEFPPEDPIQWKGLQFYQCVAAGINHFTTHPIWRTAIPVSTASGIHSVPMAEFATCGLLMLAHRFSQIHHFKTTRQWPDRVKIGGETLRGQTVGIIGYGSIGRECARQAHALGMRVVCVKRNPRQKVDDGFNAWPGTGDPAGSIPERWFGPDQVKDMMPECNSLIVTAPRTPKTENLISASELALLRPGGWVVIISRGGIVNEADLASALRQGKVRGALVDGYLPEPPSPEHPFFDLDNVILSPHMSGVFGAYWEKLLDLFCENLRRWRAKQPLLNLANPKLGY